MPPPRFQRSALQAIAGLLLFALPAMAAKRPPPPLAACAPSPVSNPRPASKSDSDSPQPVHAEPADAWSEGSVTAGGTNVDYCAVAATLIVHPKDWDDAAQATESKGDGDDTPQKTNVVQASMFYVAYFKRSAQPSERPITFLFNGGPGSATIWLHMGAVGPRRVETANGTHSATAPYRLVNNDQSLLDASDLVFIDAPGTGFSRVTGPSAEKSFYGVDEDAHAFAEFIAAFLTKYKRWNAPKYLFGESYGTTRAAVLVNMLENDPGIEFNGIIMMSQVLSASFFPDQPRAMPGSDLPYILALPTFAATAWYHGQPAAQRSTDVPAALLVQAEHFAMGDYAAALAAGSGLDAATRDTVVTKLHTFTGLSEDYLRQADLRVTADEFRQELLRARGLVVGATDTRFDGHTLDRMSRLAHYDPSDSAMSSAYVSSFNDYVRRVLKYNEDRTYRASVDDIIEKWNFAHEPPDFPDSAPSLSQTANVMPDLARAMKLNPLLKVQVHSGFFDLLTPYFQGKYEMRHLAIPPELGGNIEYRCYRSGHMVYVAPDALRQLHDSVADFIQRTDNLQHTANRQASATAACPADQ